MLLSRNILPLLMLLCVGCNHYGEIVHASDVDPTGWFTPSRVRFEVVDTSSRVDMSIMVRYDNILAPDSIELLVSTIAPDSVMWSEHFTLYTPKDADHSIYVLDTPYRRDIKWGQAGEYNMIFHPQQLYMGVSAIGVDIKPISKKR